MRTRWKATGSTVTRRAMLRVLGVAGLGGLLSTLGCSLRKAAGGSGSPSPTGSMMGSATSADMSTYMDLFNHHTEIQRTVEEIPGGVRTTTESNDPALAAQLQTHVAAMYQHVGQGQEVTCMSSSLPTLFRNSSGYQRQLTITARGITVTETSSDRRLVQAIRHHADEITGFVEHGMPAMMRGMMGG